MWGVVGIDGRVGRCLAGPGLLSSAPGPPKWPWRVGVGIQAQSLLCLGWGGRSRDHCAQPPGTSSHPVGTGSPPKCQLGCSSPPTANASVDHWLSLPGRPREGWSGAARTPGTPRTPRACRLRVGAGCKDLHGWAHALPGPPGLVAVVRATGPPPWDNPQRHGAPFCRFLGASRVEVGPSRAAPHCPLLVQFVCMSHAPAVTCPPRVGHCPPAPGSRAVSLVREAGSRRWKGLHFSSRGPWEDFLYADTLWVSVANVIVNVVLFLLSPWLC